MLRSFPWLANSVYDVRKELQSTPECVIRITKYMTDLRKIEKDILLGIERVKIVTLMPDGLVHSSLQAIQITMKIAS